MLGLFALGLSTSPSLALASEAGDVLPERGVILHLSHGKKQAHHAIHPLVRASKMSATEIGVLVYLDVDAAPLAFEGAKPVTYRDHDSSELLRAVIDNGGKVAVCQECLAAHGKTPDDLIEGAIVATPDAFFEVGQQTITFDY